MHKISVDFINPFLHSTVSVFTQMLGVEVVREAPFLRKVFVPQFDVTGIIGLTGKATGTVAVSFPRELALNITGRLLGEQPLEIDGKVVDAVGELTNMIAGGAKSRLEELHLSLGLPTVIVGRSSCIAFPSQAAPISIPFSTTLGPLLIEVGLLMR